MLKEKAGWVVSLIHSSKTFTFSDCHRAFGGIQTVLLFVIHLPHGDKRNIRWTMLHAKYTR